MTPAQPAFGGSLGGWYDRAWTSPARRPRVALVIAAALLALAAFGLSKLRVDPSFASLLPANAPQLREMDRVRERTGGHRQLVVALSGLERAALDEVARTLAARAASREDVTSAYADLDTDFFASRALWLLDDASLDELVGHVSTLVASARRPAFGAEGERERAIRATAIERIERVAARAREARPDLALASPDGRYRFALIVPAVRVLEVEEAKATMAGLEAIADELVAAHPGLEVRFTGRFALVLEQDALVQRDMVVTSLVALVLCVLIVATYFRSVRAPLVLGLAVVVGAVLTLGLAPVTVGSLNLVSVLLLPVLLGLGIDFGIHLATRFRQRCAEHDDAASAMQRAILETRAPALVGAATTAAAFLSLTLSELRALSSLGWLAAVGIGCTLLTTYLLVPPLFVLRDRCDARRRRSHPTPPAPAPRSRGRRIGLAVAAACVILAGLGAFSARQLRFENDYRLLREDSDSDAFFEYVDDSLDMRFDPSVVFLDDVADLATARAIVERRRGVDTPRIDAVLGLDDFLPPRTDRRAAAIDTLRALLDEPMLTLADDPRLDEARALAAAEPWGVEDAPAWVRERFVARDGRGAVLLLYPDRRIQSDAAAVRWHTELEALRQELDAAGVRYAISSEALLPGWVYMAMRDEGPRLIGAEAAFVSLIVVVYFGWEARLRGVARAALVLVPLAAGVLWAAGAMAAMGAPLTMFTLFVFPCVVGIGVDDLVHLVHRHAHDGGSLRAIYRETGPAIVLTSLTTAAGFGAAVFARHPGIASVAPVAVLAVGSMLAAALVFVPALLAASSLGRPSCTPSERGPVEEPSRV